MKTRFRQAVDRELSYPIGLNDLRRALDVAPQAGEIEVTFLRAPFRSATGFRAAIGRDEPSVIIEALFTKWDKKPSLGDNDRWVHDYLKGKWELTVYPVSRSRRALARQVLIGAGLPALAAWLARTRPDSWYSGRKEFKVSFDPLEERVYWREHIHAV
jgi:hypothetical protein